MEKLAHNPIPEINSNTTSQVEEPQTISRRSFLVKLGIGAALATGAAGLVLPGKAEAAINPIKQVNFLGNRSTTSVAERWVDPLPEPASYYADGVGLPEIFYKFAETGLVGDAQIAYFERFMREMRASQNPADGICTGYSAFQSTRRNITPESAVLNGVTFSHDEINGLGALMAYGFKDASNPHPFWSPRRFDELAKRYVIQEGKGLVLDVSTDENQVWSYPVRYVRLATTRYNDGLIRVEANIQLTNYANTRGNGVARDVYYGYEYNQEDPNDHGKLLVKTAELKQSWRPSNPDPRVGVPNWIFNKQMLDGFNELMAQ